MAIVIEAPPDHPRFAAAAARVFRSWIQFGRAVIAAMVIGAGLIVGMVSEPVAGLVVAVVCAPLVLLYRWMFIRALVRTNPKLMNNPVTFTVNETGMMSISAVGRSEVPWTSFTGAYELPGQIALRLDAAFVSIPVSGLTEGQASELRSWLANAGVAVVR